MKPKLKEPKTASIQASDQATNKNLAELVKRITKENTHPSVDFGPPVGKEIW